MTNQLDIKGNGAEESDPISPNNGINKVYVIGKYDFNPWQRMIMIAPKELEGQKLPQKFLDFVYNLSPKTYDRLILGSAMQRLDNIEKAEKSNVKPTINTIKAESVLSNQKDLDSMVESYYNNFYKENILFTNNGATLAGQDNLMAHCTIAGANSLNTIDKKVMGVYDKASKKITDKISNLSPGIKRIVYVGLLSLFGLSATVGLPGCSGTVTPPVNDVDKYDTLDQPFPHQQQQESTWCLNAASSAEFDYTNLDYSQQFLNPIIDSSGVNLVNFVNNDVPGYNAKYVYISLDKIKELVNIYDIPVIVAQRFIPLADPQKAGHARVVIGYGEDYVKVSDPADGKEHILEEDYFLSLNIFWDNTDPNKNLSIVIYPEDLNLNLPQSAYKSEVEGKDYIQQTFEPIIG